MLLLHSLVSCRLTLRQAWQHVLLLWLLACVLSFSTFGKSEHSRSHRRFLHFDGVRKQGQASQLRLKLERISGSYIDRYDTLRSAIHRDRARRAQLEIRVLAGVDENVVPDHQVPSSPDPIFPGLHKASLNVISGSSVGLGEYFASIWVGTPPQKLFLIADTGSDLTWVKCQSSQKPLSVSTNPGDIPTNQSFDESVSSTFSPVSCFSKKCADWFFPPTCEVGLSRHCGFSYSYSDQSSITGSIAFESITLGEANLPNVAIGCGRQYAGPNFDKVGGVVGLGQGSLSLASQLAAQSAYSNKFSYCLADFLGPSSMSGSLAFGETLLETTLKYTPLIRNPYAETFYYVGVEVVKVGGTALDIPAYVWGIDEHGNGGTVVDSGTSLAQFAKPAYEVIRHAFQQAIHGVAQLDEGSVPGLDLCYRTDAQNSTGPVKFPDFTIVFDGELVFEPPTQNYFTEAAPGITCLAMQEARSGSFSVVGNFLQQNFHIEFDRLHNRLGVSPADCSKLHS